MTVRPEIAEPRRETGTRSRDEERPPWTGCRPTERRARPPTGRSQLRILDCSGSARKSCGL